jgi:hypothetical protein
MRSMSMLQLVGGVAAAGVVAAGTTALTGSGMTFSGTATTTQFVGGAITQTVTGLDINTVAYNKRGADPTGTQIESIAITITDGDLRWLTVAPAGGAWSSTGSGDIADANEWSCAGNVAGTVTGASPKVHLNDGAVTVTCTAAMSGTLQGFIHGVTGLTLTGSVS